MSVAAPKRLIAVRGRMKSLKFFIYFSFISIEIPMYRAVNHHLLGHVDIKSINMIVKCQMVASNLD